MLGKLAKGVRQVATGGTLSAPPRGRGSFEGYMHAAATHIQMNGAGYSNPIAQKARRPRQPVDLRINRMNPMSMGRTNSTSILDMRIKGRSGSSVERLNKQTNLNKMF